MEKTRSRLAAVSGIASVGLLIASGLIFGGVSAEPRDSAASKLTEFAAQADDIRLSALIGALGLGFLLIFLGYLHDYLRARGGGWWANVLVSGGVALTVTLVGLTALQVGAAVAADHGHGSVVEMAVDLMWEGSFMLTASLFAVGIAGVAVGLGRHALPRWLGWFSVLVTVGALAPWLGVFVFLTWLLAVSVVLTAGRREVPREAPTPVSEPLIG